MSASARLPRDVSPPSRAAARAFLAARSGRWTPEPPAPDPAALAAAAASWSAPLPAALAELYAWSNGFYVGLDVYVVPLADLEMFNAEPAWIEAFPGAVFFGMDEGSGAFFIDAEGRLGRGRAAVFWSDRSAFHADRCIHCAGDLLSFLDDVSKDRDGRERPDLVDEACADLEAALRAASGAWRPAQPGAPVAGFRDVTIFEQSRRAPLPRPLQALLGVSDGLTIPRARVEIRPLAACRPIGAGPPYLALEIGACAGAPLALSLINEAGVPPRDLARRPIQFWDGWALLPAPGRPLSEAQTLGYLPDCVAAWLQV